MNKYKLKLKDKRREFLLSLALVIFVFVVYWQVQGFKFVYYDDGSYVAERAQVMAGLTWKGFSWAMTATEAGFWHPLTWLSLMMDREVFGNNSGGYHWTNVTLHIFNTLLLFFFMNLATKAPYRSAFVALLFAIHPLHVESVAWVSQRKDLLCTLFGFASLLAYVHYAKFPGWRSYLLVFIFFVLGIMSKPMIVTIPFIMLLLDYWPLRRISFNYRENNDIIKISDKYKNCCFLLLEKVPFFILSMLASILVIITEKKANALTNLKVLSIGDRLANAIVSYAKYIAMTFWPVNLTFFYPHPVSTPLFQVIGCLLLLAIITIIIVFVYKDKPYLFTGWFWYMGTLVPVIGIIQVGPHALADRYMYIPLIGLLIIIIWGISDLMSERRYGPTFLAVVAIGVILSLTYCSWRQAGYWKNSITLFEHALEIAPTNYMALGNLGQFYINQGEYDKGLAYMNKAIQAKPNFAPFYYNTGIAFHSQGNYLKAIEFFKKAEELFFSGEDNQRLLGDCYYLTGKLPQAIGAYQRVLVKNNRNKLAKYGLALTLMEMGQQGEAVKGLKEVLSIDPHYVSARKILMLLAWEKRDMDTVVEEGKKAVANGSADLEILKMMEAAGKEKTH